MRAEIATRVFFAADRRAAGLVPAVYTAGTSPAARKARQPGNNSRLAITGFSMCSLYSRWIALVESWDDVEPFKELCHELLSDEAFEDAATQPALGIYRLQNSRAQFPWSAG